MSQMNSKIFMPAMIALMGVSASAWADKPDDGEVTIRLMPHEEAELPAAVTNPIELPRHLLDDPKKAEKVEAAKKGLDTANSRRVDGPTHGLSHAQDARETAQDMADNAKSNQETRSRSEQERPERPEPPGPPDDPPGNRP